MAANKRKILESARKLAQKGAKDKALKEYAKLIKLDPRDAKLRLEIGDAHRRWGQVEEAIVAYSSVADQFMKEGFDARAVAVYKQIQNLDQEEFSSYEPLAELYQRMGLTAEAIACLETAADAYHKAGQKEEALGLLRKMSSIDPTNTTSRIRVADLLQNEGLTEDAISEYEAVSAELQKQNDAEGVAKVFERILEIDPNRVSVLIAYSKNLIARGVAERAEALMVRAIEVERTPEHYELLADVYRSGKREDDLVRVYRDMAELYRERGDEERTREILQRYVPTDVLTNDRSDNGDAGEHDPLDEETKLDGVTGLGEEGPDYDDFALGDDDALLGEDLLADESLLLSDTDSGLGSLSPDESIGSQGAQSPLPGADANERTCIMPEAQLGGEQQGATTDLDQVVAPKVDLDQLLAEASVYLRYGKRDQAIANLEEILEREPEHRLALEKLGEVFAESDESERAIEVWGRAAGFADQDGEHDAANVIRSRIAALDPDAAEASAPSAADDLEFEIEVDSNVDIDADANEAAPSESASAEASQTQTSEDPNEISLTEIAVPEIGLSDIEIDVDAASFTMGASGNAASQSSGGAPAAESNSDEVRLDEAVPAEGGGEAEEASEALTCAGLELSASSSRQVTEELETADFYFQQDLLEEAAVIYKKVLSISPSHPHAQVRLGEIAVQLGKDPSELGEQPDVESQSSESQSAESPGGDTTDAGASADADTGGPKLADPAPEPETDSDGDPTVLVDEFDVPEEPAAPEIGADLADWGVDEPDGAEPDSEAATSAEPAPELEASAPQLATTSVDFDDDNIDPANDDSDPDDSDCFDLAKEINLALDSDDNGSTYSGQSASESAGKSGTLEDGFASVFAEFKKGVDATLTEGDYQAHYDLGIAYREMGLLGDALTEFQSAMRDPSREVTCLQLMGLCALDLGEPEQAIEHFQGVLAKPDIPTELELVLKMDLGQAYEATENTEAARSAYEDVQRMNPDHADVQARLSALDADAEKAEPDDECPKTDEYESFDGFLSGLEDGAETSDDDSQSVGSADRADEEPEAVEAAEAPKRWENFDDVISEAEEVAAAEVTSEDVAVEESDEEAQVAVELVIEEEPDAGADSVSEEAEPLDPIEPMAEAEDDPPADDTPKRSRKKKISFI